jgi:hypothetical protein
MGVWYVCRCLVVDNGSMAALQLMGDEAHGSVMGIGAPRQGFSLLALLDRCVTRMVRGRARTD